MFVAGSSKNMPSAVRGELVSALATRLGQEEAEIMQIYGAPVPGGGGENADLGVPGPGGGGRLQSKLVAD